MVLLYNVVAIHNEGVAMKVKIVDVDTGEILGDRFAKLFFDDIAMLFKLTEGEGRLLLWMANKIMLGGKNIVKMSPAAKKIAAGQIGANSPRTITEWLRRMCVKGVIKKKHPDEKFDPYYIVNPCLLFKGNDFQRAKVIIDYEEGKRRVIALVPGNNGSMEVDKAIEKFLAANPEYKDIFKDVK